MLFYDLTTDPAPRRHARDLQFFRDLAENGRGLVKTCPPEWRVDTTDVCAFCEELLRETIYYVNTPLNEFILCEQCGVESRLPPDNANFFSVALTPCFPL
jgi:hypothetical protein